MELSYAASEKLRLQEEDQERRMRQLEARMAEASEREREKRIQALGLKLELQQATERDVDQSGTAADASGRAAISEQVQVARHHQPDDLNENSFCSREEGIQRARQIRSGCVQTVRPHYSP